MTALARIKAAGFEVWLTYDGNIGIKPFDALTAEQTLYIKAHKAEIVEALAANDAKTTSEAEHNATGRFFMFLATWPDGNECYLCQMPRMTVDQMLAQYPTATKIEPTPQDYQNDEN